jgi:hypothetical protein
MHDGRAGQKQALGAPACHKRARNILISVLFFFGDFPPSTPKTKKFQSLQINSNDALTWNLYD